MNLRIYLILAAIFLLPFSSLAARSPRTKDDVTKIAIGQNEKAVETAEPNESSISPDSTDNVDKPLTRPTVIVTDAPHGDRDSAEEKVEQDDAPIGPGAHEPVTKPTAVGETKNEKQTQGVDGVSAEQSQKWLENGNTRFLTKKFRADGRSEKDRAKKEVKPHAIILSCSDSRVPPELIFDQGLGEITTIRVAGEVLDSSVIASIEQSILNEHPHLLVVLGHTQCESIEAVMGWKEKATFGSDAIDRMVSEIKPHFKTLTPGARSPGLQVEGVLQADGVARDLIDQSEVIKKAVSSGRLRIKTGLYWTDTGKVKFY